MSDPRSFYQKRTSDLQHRMTMLEGNVTRLSWARVILFLAFITLFVYFANARDFMAMIISAFIFTIAFGLLVRVFNRFSASLRFFRDLNSVYSDELKRAALDLGDLDGGDEFTDRAHAYSYDLDLFGDHSLFKLLNRTHTPDGRKTLSEWMLAPADPEEVQVRQAAIKELAEDPDWVTRFLAHGVSAAATSENASRLKKWLEEKNDEGIGVAVRLFAYLAPLILMILLGGIIFVGWSIYTLAPLLVLNAIILMRHQNKIRALAEQTDGNVKLLRSYEAMIESCVAASFRTDRLVALQAPFQHNARHSIRSLRNLLDYLDGRGNMFYSIMNAAFLLDVHLIRGLMNWKKNNQEDLVQWFENLAQLEALGSLGLHAFLHEHHQFPEMDGSWEISAADLGHPLIPAKECVTNDFEIKDRGTVNIITGSNMSGKSTFLRTVGINVVLGLMGSVVFASSMKLSMVRLFTGMRSEDDLSAHISSFYAELRRIRYLLDTVETSDQPVLFMLDEILRGTNTRDRHRGSEGLVRQLADMPAFGFISTHDLGIGELAGEDPRIHNYSFNSRITGDEIYFDYKLTEGICHSFNASKLMEKMGIRLPADQ